MDCVPIFAIAIPIHPNRKNRHRNCGANHNVNEPLLGTSFVFVNFGPRSSCMDRKFSGYYKPSFSVDHTHPTYF